MSKKPENAFTRIINNFDQWIQQTTNNEVLKVTVPAWRKGQRSVGKLVLGNNPGEFELTAQEKLVAEKLTDAGLGSYAVDFVKVQRAQADKVLEEILGNPGSDYSDADRFEADLQDRLQGKGLSCEDLNKIANRKTDTE